jgi:hypothetical protein
MSGQPNRYANSAEMFKNQYMDALNLRANVDDFNLQANKNYKKTGTLPPNVQAMVDNRTTTEILADTEKLKLNIISELKPVMNSSSASVVVQRIQTAPVNADGSFIIWVAQNISEIVKSLKKKYAIGIKGDTKDAENIVIFLSDMYSKIKDYSGTVKSYFDTVGDSKTGLKEGDLDSLRKEYELIIARLRSKFPNFRDAKFSQMTIRNLIIKTTEKIKSLFEFISSQRYKETIASLQDLNSVKDLASVNGTNDIAKALFGLYDELPSVSKVRVLYKQLEQSLNNNTPDLSYSILNEIYNIFPDPSPVINMVDEIPFPEPERGPQGQREVGELPEGYKVEGFNKELFEKLKTDNKDIEDAIEKLRSSVISNEFAKKSDNVQKIYDKKLKELLALIPKLKESKQRLLQLDKDAMALEDAIEKAQNQYPNQSMYYPNKKRLGKIVEQQEKRLKLIQKELEKEFAFYEKTGRDVDGLTKFVNETLDSKLDYLDIEKESYQEFGQPAILNPELFVSSEPIPSQKGLRSGAKQSITDYKDIEDQIRHKENQIEQLKSQYELLEIDKKQYLSNPKGSFAKGNPKNSSAYKQYETKQYYIEQQHDILVQEISNLEEVLNETPDQVKINALDYSTQKSLYEQYKPETYGSAPELSIDEQFNNAQKEHRSILEQISSLGEAPLEQRQLRIWQQKMNDLEDSEIRVERNLRALQSQLQSSVGFGLKKRRGRPKGSGISFKDNIDHDKGIQPVKKYHPFGKYFINSHKLNHGNILSIRSKSGTNVREYPSRTVTPHMASIVKTIIGGGVPSYNDMEKLSNDEKDYLYKISKRAEFADKISIPTPSKDQEEKDIHEFEVCKGEIMAGNDSKELIKKFKLLIIKLSKNGTIPKREASEVMTELLELGY